MRESAEDGEVIGEALQRETFIKVRWEWLTFLAAQIGLTAVFIVVVMFHTARLDVDIVKSSNISELFALGNNNWSKSLNDEHGSLKSSGINTKFHKDLRGRLIREDGVWSLEVEEAQKLGPKVPT